MLYISIGIISRIFSNSYLNVFQKLLTIRGQHSSVINFYTYLGLSLSCAWFIKDINTNIILLALLMGLLGTLGNYFIIKALSIGELSTLAPINSYKPIVALIVGILFLNEIPSVNALIGMLLIIIGTYFIFNKKCKINKLAIIYRILALIFSGSEAIVIKKIIIETGAFNTFILWSLTCLMFASIFLLFSKHKPIIKDWKYQILLVIFVGIMQYSTNFVFARINVSYALALFQLSTLVSVFLGANIFKERAIKSKLIGSVIMVLGAILIILT